MVLPDCTLFSFEIITLFERAKPETEGDAGRFFEFQLFFAEKSQVMGIIAIFQGWNVSQRLQ
jgi:hypothetical protein